MVLPPDEVPLAAVRFLGWKPCPTPNCRGAPAGPRGRCLAHLDDDEFGAYLRRARRGHSLDARGVRVDAALLKRILDEGPLDSSGRRSIGEARFDMAIFEGDVAFENVAFERDVSFDEADFRGSVSFTDAHFAGNARFAQVVFRSAARLNAAVFAGHAWFAGANFAGDASFAVAAFKGPAWFDGVTFQDATYSQATFDRDVSFHGAAFRCHAVFERAIFEADGDFGEAQFLGVTDFGAALFRGRSGAPPIASRQHAWSGPPIAGWGQRAGAALVDHLLALGAALPAIALSALLKRLQHGDWVGLAIALGVTTGLAVMMWNLVQQGRTGQTIGKRWVGLRLVDRRHRRPLGAKRSVGRQLLHLLGAIPLGAGWLYPLRDPSRQTLADKVCSSVVIVVSREWHRINSPDIATTAASPHSGFG